MDLLLQKGLKLSGKQKAVENLEISDELNRHPVFCKLEQFRFEKESWKRILGFIEQENEYFERRLLEVLKKSADLAFMPEFIYFKSWIADQDEKLKRMRKSLYGNDYLLTGELSVDSSRLKKIIHQQKTMRMEMKIVEETFYRLKINFNYFLGECL